MIRILSLLLCFFLCIEIYSQQAIGDWINFNVFTAIDNVEETKNKVYYTSGGYLYSYDKDDNSIDAYSKVGGLSDFDISFINYNKATNQLVVIYSNLNIDLIRDNKVYNISDVKDKTVSGDKTPYHVSESGKYVLISTGFGLVLLDTDKKEISDSYNWSRKILCSVMSDNKIYVSSDGFGIKTGDINDNLSDFSKWTTLTSGFAPIDLIDIAGRVYCLKSNKEVNIYNKESGNFDFVLGDWRLSNLKKSPDNNLIAFGKNSPVFYIAKNDNSYQTVTLPNSTNSISSYSNNSVFWSGDLKSSLTSYHLNENNEVTVRDSEIGYNGIGTDYPYQMSFMHDRLYVSGGGKGYDRDNRPALVDIYSEGSWSQIDRQKIVDAAGMRFDDVVHTLVDPNDPSHFYCFTWGEGVFEIKDNELVKLYNYSNSGVESIFGDNPNYHRVDGGAFDKDGNIWFTNSEINNPVKMVPNGNSWDKIVNVNVDPLKSLYSLGKVMVTSRNYKWININHAQNTKGYAVIDDSGSASNPSGYNYRFFSSVTYNDSGSPVSVDITTTECVAEDNYGRVWIGSDKGPFVVNNETTIFKENSIPFSRIKVSRNDGTDLADFLLESETIKSIAIDGGNRKWFGTASGGAYLVSDDCQEEIYHFTTENSPLPSNHILQIAIDNNTGLVYFGTDKGLIAFQSDANDGRKDYSDVYAFPNPVRPEYSGVITITGLMSNSLVKITDVNNNLIYQTTSLGGMATWNGLNTKGERASTGVYFVYGTSEDAKKGIVTKILFVK